MDPRFVVDPRGVVTPADNQPSSLVGRTGFYRLQATSPDWILLLRSPAQGGIWDKRPRVVLAGDVALFATQDLIAFLGQSRWGGVVRVTTPGNERSLLLKDGEVRSAASDSTADRIGEVMIRLGYVTRGQLDKVLNDAPPSRIGRAMVERGLLKAHDLYKCLNEQISEIFHGMMLAKEGSFALIDQELDEKVLVHNLSLSVQGLLMDSIRKIDELAQFRKKIPNAGLYVLRKKHSDGKLEPEEDALLAQADGDLTVLELGQAMKVSEFEATRVVYRLLEGGFVQLTQTPIAPLELELDIEVTPMAPQPAQSATPTRPAVLGSLSVDEHKIVNVFNFIFREVRNEVARHGDLDDFIASANASLRGSGVSTSQVLNSLSFQADGSLPDAQVLSQFEQLKAGGHMGSEPLLSLKQALSDVMFFLLFQAGEMLESRADEDLARRVKELLATIDVK